MVHTRNQSKQVTRSRACCSFRWLLVTFITAAGVCPLAICYLAWGGLSGQLSLGPPSLPMNENNGKRTTVDAKVKVVGSSSTTKHKKNTDVIVYLAQFGNHSSYGAQYDAKSKRAITGLSKLNKSLELLYVNYVYQHPDVDVIVFYDPDSAPADDETIAALRRNRPNLQFRSLEPVEKWWSLPYGLRSWEIILWKRPAFSVGYRLMMRWYAVLIWRYLDAEGYTHCMRLDDDSYVLSKITYNVFDFMRKNKKRYAFRQPAHEGGGPEFDALMDGYLAENPNATTRESLELYERDRMVGFYNNFFVADVSFFVTPPASSLLRVIDESKLMFTHRLGDLIIQSAAVRLFLKPEEVHWFRDFTYEHMTLCRKDKCGPMIKKGCPQNGGVSRGIGVYTNDEWIEFASREVKSRFEDHLNKCFLPINQNFVGAEDVRICSRLRSQCGFYLNLVLGVNDTEEGLK